MSFHGHRKVLLNTLPSFVFRYFCSLWFTSGWFFCEIIHQWGSNNSKLKQSKVGPNLQNSVPLSILALPMPRTHWISAVPIEDTPTEITLLASPFHKLDTILIHAVYTT